MVKNSSALNLDAVIRELYQQQLVAPNSESYTSNNSLPLIHFLESFST